MLSQASEVAGPAESSALSLLNGVRASDLRLAFSRLIDSLPEPVVIVKAGHDPHRLYANPALDGPAPRVWQWMAFRLRHRTGKASYNLLLGVPPPRSAGRNFGGGPGWDGEGTVSTLTEREWEVACLAADGLTNPQIAALLFRSPATVRTHIARVLHKLGFVSRSQVAAWVERQKIIQSAD